METADVYLEIDAPPIEEHGFMRDKFRSLAKEFNAVDVEIEHVKPTNKLKNGRPIPQSERRWQILGLVSY